MKPHPSLSRVAIGLLAAVTALLGPLSLRAAEDELTAQLRALDATVLKSNDFKDAPLNQMLSRDVAKRRRAVNERDQQAWQQIKTKEDWEKFRDVRIKALKESLGSFPAEGKKVEVRVLDTKVSLADKFLLINNIVFESRPGLLVTANLYVPEDHALLKSMPGILICHSHHNPKEQSELQDMAMTWACQGCAVLVMDEIGHGERRQHPFKTEKDYPDKFRAGRQDYFFRYNTGMQLDLVGESLAGWMAGDILRGVDVLSAIKNIDKDRIILLGAVAGGGDQAAVAAALDSRIKCVAPFNFGGPQPETTYPLPPEAERMFNYLGGGSWESTRNLKFSGRDGFLPWVIVGSVAPRYLIYGHEFSWDKEHDPVWARFQKIYSFYGADKSLASVHGRGKVTGTAGPENTHCNNIGPEHRQQIYPAFKEWFQLPVPQQEAKFRRPADDLQCLTPKVLEKVKPALVHELAGELADRQIAQVQLRGDPLDANKRKEQLKKEWQKLLGNIDPKDAPKITVQSQGALPGATVRRLVLEVEPGIVVPVLLLLPEGKKENVPVVIGLAQEGKQAFLKQRADMIAGLLKQGVAVCLPDVRGTGETRPGNGRDRNSAATSISSSEWMLGQTLVGSRLRDVRSVIRALKNEQAIDAARIALWGDSFAPVNAKSFNPAVPLDADKFPPQAEPLGGLLALFGALYEDKVQAVTIHGGLVSYRSVLESPFCYVPHDSLVPGALKSGDLCDVAAAIAPRSLRLEGLVDGLNRQVNGETLAKSYLSALIGYKQQGRPQGLRLDVERAKDDALAQWLAAQLKGKGG
jgi:cephalosporin-C deacetylase-like acetyl esterase